MLIELYQVKFKYYYGKTVKQLWVNNQKFEKKDIKKYFKFYIYILFLISLRELLKTTVY